MSVDDCRWLEVPRITDPRGNLGFLEGGRHVPFAIRRVYYLYDIPAGASRGGHAHKQLEQVLLAPAGSFDVVLDDGVNRRRVTLSAADRGLYIPRLIWRELDSFSANAVCLVLASDYYSEDDYYRDYADFALAVKPT